MKGLLGIFTKRKQNGMKKFELKRQIDNLKFTISSDGTITTISEAEVDNIVKIAQEELKNVSNWTGRNIARRIATESANPEICAVYVDEGDDGIDWLIQLSSNPFGFID